MGIKEWLLRPWFWWKKHKAQQITVKVMQETGCDMGDIGGGLDPEKVAVFKERLQQKPDPIIRQEASWPYLDRPTKTIKRMEIAAKNRERQRNTLGFGLKSGNFKPRPSYEKKLYDLTKKPKNLEDPKTLEEND